MPLRTAVISFSSPNENPKLSKYKSLSLIYRGLLHFPFEWLTFAITFITAYHTILAQYSVELIFPLCGNIPHHEAGFLHVYTLSYTLRVCTCELSCTSQ